MPQEFENHRAADTTCLSPAIQYCLKTLYVLENLERFQTCQNRDVIERFKASLHTTFLDKQDQIKAGLSQFKDRTSKGGTKGPLLSLRVKLLSEATQGKSFLIVSEIEDALSDCRTRYSPFSTRSDDTLAAAMRRGNIALITGLEFADIYQNFLKPHGLINSSYDNQNQSKIYYPNPLYDGIESLELTSLKGQSLHYDLECQQALRRFFTSSKNSDQYFSDESFTRIDPAKLQLKQSPHKSKSAILNDKIQRKGPKEKLFYIGSNIPSELVLDKAFSFYTGLIYKQGNILMIFTS